MSQSNDGRPSRFWMTVLLVIAAGATAFQISPVSAEKPVVTIAAHGSGSYYLGEEAVFSGMNTGSDSTYLFMTGPNLPENGGKLTSPSQKAVSGDPGSFTVVKTRPDTTWEYTFYTYEIQADAGTYTLYAVSQPKAKDQLEDAAYGTTGIILKKPFIAAGITPSPVPKGQPFTITGYAEGIPTSVQIWIIGDNYVYTTTTPVQSDASYSFNASADVSENLPGGQNYLFVQHPMQDNRFDLAVGGDYVRSLKLDNGTNLFRITGPGSLQGRDAAEALVAAFSDPTARDTAYATDTYAVIPFQVTDAGSPAPQTTTVTTDPAQQTNRPDFLHLTLAGVLVLVVGVVVWKRH